MKHCPTARSGDELWHLHNALLLVLRLEMVRPVVCRDEESRRR